METTRRNGTAGGPICFAAGACLAFGGVVDLDRRFDERLHTHRFGMQRRRPSLVHVLTRTRIHRRTPGGDAACRKPGSRGKNDGARQAFLITIWGESQ